MTRFVELDHAAFVWVNRHVGGVSDYFFGWPTYLITLPGMLVLLFVFLRIWEPKNFWAKFLPVSTAALAGGTVSQALKELIDRPRPLDAFYDRPIETLYAVYVAGSFPSSHTALAFGAAAGLARFYPKQTLFFCVLAAFLSMTRVYVGAHFPSDVLAGALIGAASGALTARWCERALSKR